MSLRVWTARVTYAGPDRLDVTRRGNDSVGVVFAPTWDIVRPFLADVKAGRALLASATSDADELRGHWLQSRAWGVYWGAYVAEMRASYKANTEAWRAVIARETVTLCCFCTEPSKCHRMIAAAHVLPALGATYEGERD